MEHILAGMSGFSLTFAIFGAPVRFWTLWLFESLYVGLDRLTLMHLSIWGWPQERASKIMLA